jgi:predicted DNA-binding transcriptional regulator AlpA
VADPVAPPARDRSAQGCAVKLSLDAIASGAGLAGLSRPELAALLATCAAIEARIAAALLAGTASPVTVMDDRLLDVRQAAAKLNVSRTWLYKRPRLPFAVRIGGHVRYSERRLNHFIALRSGGGTSA